MNSETYSLDTMFIVMYFVCLQTHTIASPVHNFLLFQRFIWTHDSSSDVITCSTVHIVPSPSLIYSLFLLCLQCCIWTLWLSLPSHMFVSYLPPFFVYIFFFLFQRCIWILRLSLPGHVFASYLVLMTVK